MRKVRKLDFVLEEKDNSVLIFRFYPRRSSCHSFGDEPPKSWSDVYKVYYTYSIFRRYKDDNSSEILFESCCDECSLIDEVAERCRLIADGTKVYVGESDGEKYSIKLLDTEMIPFGYGVTWVIKQCRQKDIYQFNLWNWCEMGFRFYLEKDEMRKFGEYLLGCCEYMLAHGDPI